MKDLAQKYEGVVAPVLDHGHDAQTPAGMSKLKEYHADLPETLEGGRLEKDGLTKNGHAVYRNTVSGMLVYYSIRVGRDGEVSAVKPRGHGLDRDERDPRPGFGDDWIITP